MTVNKNIIDNLFQQFSKCENVRILNEKEKHELGLGSKHVVWEVDTEIHLFQTCASIIFHTVFLNDFPLEIPKIYLAPESYAKFKYIPHVDTERLVCTYDSESITTNPNDPLGILLSCLKRAKDIIINGLTSSNNSDFEDEFIAYWEGKYENSEKIPLEVLSIIDNILNSDKLKLICLKRKFRGYEYVLHQDNYESKTFKDYLNSNKIEYNEVEVFYLEDLPTLEKPPFNLRNKETLKFLNNKDLEKKFFKFINSKVYPKLVVSRKVIKGNEFIFGWFYDYLNTNIKGFRPGYFRQIDAINKTQANSAVRRVTTNKYTINRLTNRTTGISAQQKKYLFAIAGVGSIGSNLCYYLNSLNFPDFYLVDEDKLKLENIGRHFLGFNSIGEYKTIALQKYLTDRNILQSVSTSENSITSLIPESQELLNRADYLFVAIGKSNIESWIGNSIESGYLKIPAFFLWVEPYLCGGHCLFIRKGSTPYSNFFVKDLFKFNVISNSEYEKEDSRFLMKEAGCQTTFLPYSAFSISAFLAAVFPKICSIIDGKMPEKSIAYTWIGDTSKIKKLDVKLSEIGVRYNEGEIIENTL